MRALDLSGQTFGRLFVVRIGDGRRTSGGRRQRTWVCKCECGNETTVSLESLRDGGTKSCGCLKRDVTIERNTTHGMCGTAEYLIWTLMQRRCTDPRDANWNRYGGRGITVCERWSDPAKFLEDMGTRPTDKHQIERKNNNLGYFKGNCKWATSKEQNNNKSSNVFLDVDGVRNTVANWAEAAGVHPQTLYSRISRGWTPDQVVKVARNTVHSGNRILTTHNESKTITDWARSLGLNRCAISARILKGWTEERAVTTPRQRKNCRAGGAK